MTKKLSALNSFFKRFILPLKRKATTVLFFTPKLLRKIDGQLYRVLKALARKSGPLKPIFRKVHKRILKTEEWFLTYLARNRFRNALSFSCWSIGIILVLLFTVTSKAATATLVPDGDYVVSWPSTAGSNDASCSGGTHCDFVDEGSTVNTSDYISTGTNGTGGEAEEFDMTTVGDVGTASSIVITVNAMSATNANGGTLDTLDVNLRLGGILQTATSCTPAFNSWTNCNATFNGSFSQAEIDSLRVRISRTILGSGNPNNQDDDIRIASVYITLTYTQSTSWEQASFRWFQNQDSTYAAFDSDGIYTNNVTTANDAIYTSTKDNDYLYVAGYEGNNGIDWRVEKHKLTDGSLDQNFGNGGALQINPTANDDRIESIVVDENYIYLAGTQTVSAGDTEWRVEKRNKTTGVLCSSSANCAAGAFDTDGIITYSLGSFGDKPNEMHVDGDYLYIVGSQYASSTNSEWRVEKRNKTTGLLCSSVGNCTEGAFDTDGVITYSISVNHDYLDDVLVSGDYVYLSGGEHSLSSTNSAIRTEKRNKLTGALCSSVGNCSEGVFGTAGVVTYNPTSNDDDPGIDSMYIDGDYLYNSLTTTSITVAQLTKRNRITGALCSSGINCTEGAFDTDGVIDLSYSGAAITFFGVKVDGSSVYWAGHDRSQDGGFSRWNIRKYSKTTGAADNGFGTSGEVFSNPSTNHDEVRDLEIDANSMWVSGYDFSNGNAQWRIEKRKLSNGDLLSLANAGGVDVGSALAAQDTTATAPVEGTPFRLRMNLHASVSDATPGSATFKLQYALRGSDNVCDTSFTNETYADIEGGTPIAYANNTKATDGQIISTNANDPIHSGHTLVHQSYEESNNFSISTTIANGSDGMWDFVLVDNGAVSNATFCFRAVSSAGAVISSYSSIPEISITSSAVEQSAYRVFDNNNTTDVTTFVKSWGGTEGDKFRKVVQTSDGGYAALGYTSSTALSSGSDDAVIVKYDSSGVEQWSKRWGGTGIEVPRSLIEISDGSLIFTGYTRSTELVVGSNDYFLVKLNSSGVEQWSKTWGGDGDDAAYDLLSTADGGFIVHGNNNSTGLRDGGYDQTVVKYNSSGVEQWSKTWGGAGYDIAFGGVTSTSDGGFVTVGATNTGAMTAGGYDQTVVKYNSSGVEQWSKTWGGADEDIAYDVVETSDGGLAVTGYSISSSLSSGNYDQTLFKLNSSGEKQWTKSLGRSGDETGYSLIETTDGGLVVVGETNSSGLTSGGIDQLIIKYTSSGLVEWTKTWGGAGEDVAETVIETSDGGLVVAGYTNSAGLTAGNYDGVLIKLSSEGVIGNCGSCVNHTLESINRPTAVISQTITEVDRTATETDHALTETDITSASTETTNTAMASSVVRDAPKSSLNTPASLNSVGAQFRLRIGLHASVKSILSGSFKLQYSTRGADNICDTGFTNEIYSDVQSATGALRFFDNTSGDDGAAISADVNDPTHGTDNFIAQTYEENNNFSVGAGVPIGSDGMWDFALVDNSAPAGTTYCFRIVKSDGGLLDSYSVVPEITTASGAANSAPAAPTLSAPSDTAAGVSIAPTFQFRSSDADNDYLQYKIEVCSDSACTSILRTIDQTASQTGWSGQDAQTNTAYVGSSTLASSTLASHAYQTPGLTNSTQYWWRAYAIDPGGSNTWSSASSIYSFTTVSAGSTSNTYFNGGVRIRGGTRVGN